ncbi:MAG: DUF6252 family protein [Nonlabens sp.]|uniref:DUF6252 family protein n=1 Tax=Nonlabens sp. TaxID=1888209 RepID=UPI00321C2D12
MIFKRIIALLCFSALVLSCTTDIEPLDPSLNPNLNGGGNENNGNAIFTADIDGTFNDFSSSIIAEQSQDGLSIGTLGNPTLVIQIFNPSVGSFTVDAANTNTGAILLYSSGTNSLYVPASGTVTITAYDSTNRTVTGTFNGIMQDVGGADPDVVITNGVFENITFTEAMATDMASATVNGNMFVANLFATAESGNSIGVTFSNSVNEEIGLTFPLDITPGTYTIEAFGSGAMYLGTYSNDNVNNGSTHRSVAGSGDLVITDVTAGVITGTFNFTAVDPADMSSSFDITNGSFIMDIN